MTDAERLLWQRLRKRQLAEVKFRRQAPIGKYIVDFASFEKKLIVELDGGQHTLQRDYDSTRTKWLESEGFQVLRFWNYQVFEDIDTVLEVIWNAVHDDCCSESPPP